MAGEGAVFVGENGAKSVLINDGDLVYIDAGT